MKKRICAHVPVSCFVGFVIDLEVLHSGRWTFIATKPTDRKSRRCTGIKKEHLKQILSSQLIVVGLKLWHQCRLSEHHLLTLSSS